jgi:chromosome partitioning protein
MQQRLLLVSSPKGGVGKTMTVRTCAIAASAEGLKVLVVDFDCQRNVRRWLEKRPKDGVHSFDYANGAFGTTRADEMSVDEVLDVLKEYDLVIVDTPTAVEEHPEEIKKLIVAASFIVVPTGDSADDLDSTTQWMRMIRRFHQQGAAFILNRINQRSKAVLRAKQRLVRESKLCPIEVPTYEDIKTALDFGLMAFEIKGARGGDDLLRVWDYIRNEMDCIAPMPHVLDKSATVAAE